jgi:D-amino-acid oxidase
VFEKVADPKDVILWQDRIPIRHRYTPGVAGEAFFTALRERGELVAARCEECQVTYCPARLFCERCFAGPLAADKTVYPVKGQSVRVKGRNDGGYYLDQHGDLALCYVLPRSSDIVLGGTAVEHDATTESEEQVTKEIIRKAQILDPSLKIDEVKEVRAGLRPARPEVCLEAEKKNGMRIIHNYGHGGAGFTLSWGCADVVVELSKNCMRR